ncbi:MAG: NrdJb [Pseudomonadales bacterium]|nr:NrdJb [Pseudomonadales bacterium]
MAIKINKPITGYEVVKETSDTQKEQVQSVAEQDSNIEHMHEKLERPEMLLGSTYKIKTPLSEHAVYLTINDIVLNPGSEHQIRRPFEIFINSKNMDHFQWVVALTRVISAVFRKGGDSTFLVEELKAVFDPQGGYFKKGGVYMPSLVAEMGSAIEIHMKMIGMIVDEGLDEHQKQLIESKRAEYAAQNESQSKAAKGDSNTQDFPDSAVLCKKCSTKAVIMMDGCLTCLNCGDSKCS